MPKKNRKRCPKGFHLATKGKHKGRACVRNK